jgi:hypothetical protein
MSTATAVTAQGTALVTGATSGIGRATALKLAREGWDVVVQGRNPERGREVVATIESDGGRARFVAADLNDLEQVRRLAAEVGSVDVLVNNAGTSWFGPAAELDSEEYDILFDGNVRAAYYLVAALAPAMAARGRRRGLRRHQSRVDVDDPFLGCGIQPAGRTGQRRLSWPGVQHARQTRPHRRTREDDAPRARCPGRGDRRHHRLPGLGQRQLRHRVGPGRRWRSHRHLTARTDVESPVDPSRRRALLPPPRRRCPHPNRVPPSPEKAPQ